MLEEKLVEYFVKNNSEFSLESLEKFVFEHRDKNYHELRFILNDF